MNTYACEVIESESEEFVSETTTKERIFKIGQSTYRMQYLSSQKSGFTGEVIERYGILEPDGTTDHILQDIYIDAKTEEIILFHNINPYPAIENIEKMSDSEIKETVELLLSDLADFSQYNHFELKRLNGHPLYAYSLKWQVKREIFCNISVRVYITSDGSIDSFDKEDACPTDIERSLVSDAERNQLIEDKLKEELGDETFARSEYEIFSETLTYYNNEPAVIYSVEIIGNGFSQVKVLVIH
ncbi:MAG: hypothetical protein IJO64_05240 [Clostridia bacterium]|nr:hypothetical protein [Clostridia bacterium]